MASTAPSPHPPGRLARLLLPVVAAGLGGVVVAVTLGRPAPAPQAAWPSYGGVFDRVAPGVVNVHLEGPAPRLGTGFAIADDLVVTAWHLVAGLEEAEVRDLDGRDLRATVVGTDARADLALLRVADARLVPLDLGSSDALRVGDTVVAVGNPYGLGHTLSVGVVGHRGRRLAVDAPDGPRVDFLQLSIPLNPGNSGGPVLDGSGRVVGVLTGTHTRGQGIAFAVPVEVLEASLPALRRGARVSRAFLGVRTERVDAGVRIATVIPSSPADQAGLRAGDLVRVVDGEIIEGPAALEALLDRLAGGDRVTVRVRRGQDDADLDVVLADWAEQPVVVMGMTLRPRPGSGGEVVAVRPRSRAERAGIEVGDVLRTVNGVPVHAPAEVKDAVADLAVVRLDLVRGGVPLSAQLD